MLCRNHHFRRSEIHAAQSSVGNVLSKSCAIFSADGRRLFNDIYFIARVRDVGAVWIPCDTAANDKRALLDRTLSAVSGALRFSLASVAAFARTIAFSVPLFFIRP